MLTTRHLSRPFARPSARGLACAAGLLGSTGASALDGITIDFQLLDPAAAAVPLGNSVVIGALLGVIASVFLFRRRSAAIPAVVLAAALGGLAGGTAPGVAVTLSAVATDLGAQLAGRSKAFSIAYGSAAGQGLSPAEALQQLKGQSFTASLSCPRSSGEVSLSNPFVGDAAAGASSEAMTAALRIESLTAQCPRLVTSSGSCRADTTLQPGESCTVGVMQAPTGV